MVILEGAEKKSQCLEKQAKERSLRAAPLHNSGLNQDPEPLLLLHQQTPVLMFKSLNIVVMKSPYRNEDLHLHTKVGIMHGQKTCSSNLNREKAKD